MGWLIVFRDPEWWPWFGYSISLRCFGKDDIFADVYSETSWVGIDKIIDIWTLWYNTRCSNQLPSFFTRKQQCESKPKTGSSFHNVSSLSLTIQDTKERISACRRVLPDVCTRNELQYGSTRETLTRLGHSAQLTSKEFLHIKKCFPAHFFFWADQLSELSACSVTDKQSDFSLVKSFVGNCGEKLKRWGKELVWEEKQ